MNLGLIGLVLAGLAVTLAGVARFSYLRRAGRPCRHVILIIFGAMPVILTAGIAVQVRNSDALSWYVVPLHVLIGLAMARLVPIALAEEAERQRANSQNSL